MAGSEVSAEIFLRTIPRADREIVTEAIYECLRRDWPLNLMEIGYVARELRRKTLANGEDKV